ncbi:hypothetical protein GW17_00061483 [Ensete ventricosum]|nr:hypothetical protein GW17_00061483 [Ensete ventricosum]
MGRGARAMVIARAPATRATIRGCRGDAYNERSLAERRSMRKATKKPRVGRGGTRPHRRRRLWQATREEEVAPVVVVMLHAKAAIALLHHAKVVPLMVGAASHERRDYLRMRRWTALRKGDSCLQEGNNPKKVSEVNSALLKCRNFKVCHSIKIS